MSAHIRAGFELTLPTSLKFRPNVGNPYYNDFVANRTITQYTKAMSYTPYKNLYFTDVFTRNQNLSVGAELVQTTGYSGYGIRIKNFVSGFYVGNYLTSVLPAGTNFYSSFLMFNMPTQLLIVPRNSAGGFFMPSPFQFIFGPASINLFGTTFNYGFTISPSSWTFIQFGVELSPLRTRVYISNGGNSADSGWVNCVGAGSGTLNYFYITSNTSGNEYIFDNFAVNINDGSGNNDFFPGRFAIQKGTLANPIGSWRPVGTTDLVSSLSTIDNTFAQANKSNSRVYFDFSGIDFNQYAGFEGINVYSQINGESGIPNYPSYRVGLALDINSDHYYHEQPVPLAESDPNLLIAGNNITSQIYNKANAVSLTGVHGTGQGFTVNDLSAIKLFIESPGTINTFVTESLDPTITSTGSITTYQYSSVNYAILATNNTIAFTASLPVGLYRTPNTANNNIITGSFLSQGTFFADIFAKNTKSTATGSVMFTVNPPVVPVMIFSTSSYNYFAQETFTQSLSASNNPNVFYENYGTQVLGGQYQNTTYYPQTINKSFNAQNSFGYGPTQSIEYIIAPKPMVFSESVLSRKYTASDYLTAAGEVYLIISGAHLYGVNSANLDGVAAGNYEDTSFYKFYGLYNPDPDLIATASILTITTSFGYSASFNLSPKPVTTISNSIDLLNITQSVNPYNPAMVGYTISVPTSESIVYLISSSLYPVDRYEVSSNYAAGFIITNSIQSKSYVNYYPTSSEYYVRTVASGSNFGPSKFLKLNWLTTTASITNVNYYSGSVKMGITGSNLYNYTPAYSCDFYVENGDGNAEINSASVYNNYQNLEIFFSNATPENLKDQIISSSISGPNAPTPTLRIYKNNAPQNFYISKEITIVP